MEKKTIHITDFKEITQYLLYTSSDMDGAFPIGNLDEYKDTYNIDWTIVVDKMFRGSRGYTTNLDLFIIEQYKNTFKNTK